jgi:hypothetical protein
VFGNRLSNVCIPCQERGEKQHEGRLIGPPAPVQKGLFQ